MRRVGLIPKLRPLYCRVPKHGFSRTPWHTYAHPPVSVYGTGPFRLTLEGFLGAPFSSLAPPEAELALTTRFMRNGFANPAPLRAQRIIPGSSEDARTRHSIETGRECRNIHLLSIDYAFRPRLRSRLTQGRFALPWKPWVYGGQDFHLSFCYLCRHSHFATLHGCSRSRFSAVANAPLPLCSP